MNFITQAQLTAWLDGLARQRMLIAPRQVASVILYQPVESSQEIAWGFTRPVMSVKEAFFPPTERLLTIQKSDGGIELNETLFEGQQVVFGVRPCDARGVKILDALFLDKEPVDPYYARRRANTALIGLACKEMRPTCFCTSVGGAPDEAGDMDVMLYEVDGGYIVEAVTEKGRLLIPGGEWQTCPERSRRVADGGLALSVAEGSQMADSRSQMAKGERQAASSAAPNSQPAIGHQPSAIRNLPSSIPNPQSISWPAHFDDEYWARMSERCLSCRACAYVCPTCRCFIVRDEILPFEAATGKPGNGQFERIRCWDSCEGENYRRTAGGHRPRAEKSERLRNRFFCKFYYYAEQYGLGQTSVCTGCGRCVDVCPVNVDITEVLMEVHKETSRQGNK